MAGSQILVVIGALLLASLALETVGRLTRLPRVTVLVVFGIAIGPSGLGILPREAQAFFPTLSVLALVMVSFLLGGTLTRSVLRTSGRQILWVSLLVAFSTAAIVCLGLVALGFHPALALLFAGITTSTDPAATQDVVRRSGAGGRFQTILLGVVAVDDAWGLMIFGLLMAVAQAFTDGQSMAGAEILLRELGGAVLIGLAVGLPAAYLTGRVRPGEPMQVEAIGVVCLIGGVAVMTGASFLMAAMIAGALVANLARHHTRAFHEIENIEWPFMVLFFVLAGAALEIEVLAEIGVLGVAVIGLRALARVVSGPLSGLATGLEPRYRGWIGVALMPQAGVAIGMALVAADAFPELGETIIATTIGATVVFEILGPPLTLLALRKTGGLDEPEQKRPT